MEKLTKEDIKVGMLVQLDGILESLVVAADEKGPTYTGKEYEDNEISYSHARAEAENGFLYKL